MLSFAQVEEPRGVVGPLTLPVLIECLEERIGVIRQIGEGPMPVEIGGLADLLEQTVQYLNEFEARAVRVVAEVRRDYGDQ